MTTHRLSLRVAIALAAVFPAAAAAQSSQFIVLKGKDTVAVETFSRTGSMLKSEIYQTDGMRTRYIVMLAPDSLVRRVEITRAAQQGSIAMTVTFSDTLITRELFVDGQIERSSYKSYGAALPFLAVSFALSEQVVRQSRLAVGKSMTWTALRLAVSDTTTLTITRTRADSAVIKLTNVEVRLALSPNGEVIGGAHVGNGWLVERKAVP